MGLKDLLGKALIADYESDEQKPVSAPAAPQNGTTTKFPNPAPSEAQPASVTTFPNQVATPSFTPVTPVTAAPIFGGTPSVTSEHLEKALDLYQKGFDSFNQPGFDFYEFFQSVVTGGIESPQVYAMAFQMASAMDKTISKDTLTSQADFYLGEIQKLYEEYATKGKAKRQEVQDLKVNENQLLTTEVQNMEHQLEILKSQIEDRKNKLLAIDGKYNPQLSEIDSKLAANDMAKDRILQTIQTVKQGILTNIK